MAVEHSENLSWVPEARHFWESFIESNHRGLRLHDFLVVVIVCSFAFEPALEGPYASTQRMTQLGEPAVPEEQHDEGQNDQMSKTKSKHIFRYLN